MSTVLRLAGRRFGLLIFAYLMFSVVYLSAGALGVGRAAVLSGGLLDRMVPRIDESVWVYMSQLPFLAILLWQASDELRLRVLTAMAFATLVAAAVFILYPTTLPRQTPPGEGVTDSLVSLLYACDVPTNCFPSLHVALAALATRAAVGAWTRRVAVFWASAIGVSTLTTGQHLVVDVLGGLFLAVAAWAVTNRLPIARARHG
jgi:membrane-associated phospholipid phosphatase